MTPMMRFGVRCLVMVVMAWVAGPGMARAALVLQGTRIVYASDAKDVSIRVRNAGAEPLLVQSWLDDGRADLSPEIMVVPFIVSPAVTRIEPESTTRLRLYYSKQPLATDRESVFYLNVQETPPRGEQANSLALRFRTRIKVFFRPAGLPGSVDSAPETLKWTPVQGGVEVRNPTPYHLSFLSVEVESGKQRYHLDKIGQDSMVAPFSTLRFDLPVKSGALAANAVIHYSVVNDFGGALPFQRALSAP